MGAYERTQHAGWMWFIFIPVIAIEGAVWFMNPGVYTLLPLALVVIVLGVVGTVFTRLTIRVDANATTWHFGWGIHWTIWHGWLWNVGGFQAVEIFKNDGSRLTLGTDDPQGLLQAIERFRKGAA